ncbi:hypothetical protein [Pelotalea chapellei]|uniref:Phage shock protein A n=1 Tax=Pelotalea chapellei TaxID=44671 RepID=A0ABS5U9P2_9BACT|nr:hypothetical protein [Pelotalea chapellei]MBT1072366.1 hypothetical protein [Pelotalea chapellei]
MTRMETSRVREVLALHIGSLREQASHLNEDNFEQMERDLRAMERSVREARSLIEGLPHRNQK